MGETGVGLLGPLAHVVLIVRVLPRAVTFYRDVLGLPLQGEMGNWAFFSAGGVSLALQQIPGEPFPETMYTSELVFRVDDIDAAYVALEARGARFLAPVRQFTGQDFGANLRDPDQHVLTLMGPRIG